jgi:hypothetical protein
VGAIGIEHSTEDLIKDGVEPPNKFDVWAIPYNGGQVDAASPNKNTDSTASFSFLGTFTFENSIGRPAQNFTVAAMDGMTRDLIIEFTNEGDRGKTCLYGIRVYGQAAS